MTSIIVNGVPCDKFEGELSYDAIVNIAGLNPKLSPLVTYGEGLEEVTLVRFDTVNVQDGMEFTVVYDNAL